MLNEDLRAVRDLVAELEGLAAHFADADPPTARFLRVLLSLLRNQQPPRAELQRLRADYAAAFRQMFALIEDAGWAVRK